MKTVKIAIGLPGSGKSHWAKEQLAEQGAVVFRVSADDYLIGTDDVYRFNPSQIPEAHNSCFSSFLELLQCDMGDRAVAVIVDNTNLSEVALAPYMAAASAFGCVIELHVFDTNPVTAFARQKHGVPSHTFNKMCDALDKLRRGNINPGFFLWKCTIVHHEGNV